MTSSPLAPPRGRMATILAMLWRDKFATAAVLFLAIAILCAIFGPALIGDGKIFVLDVAQAMRVRTGETGDDAL